MVRFLQFTIVILMAITLNAQTLLSEDFESSTGIPATWTTVNEVTTGDPADVFAIESSGEAYYFGAGNTYLYTVAGMSGNYAIANSDAAGSGAATFSLISPAFDASALTGETILLLANDFFAAGYGGAASISVSSDGGTNWTSVKDYGASDDYAQTTIDITTAVNYSATAHVKFSYSADFAMFYAVDNIVVQVQPDAPGAVINPVPADGATDVQIELTEAGSKKIDFTFDPATTGGPATSYNWKGGLYAVVDSLSLSVTGFNPQSPGITYGNTYEGGWQENTTYYWIIEAVGLGGTTTSPIFSFTTGGDPLSSDELLPFAKIKLYPNPASDYVNVELPFKVDRISVLDVNGKQVKEISNPSVGVNLIQIEELSSGNYFVKLESGNKTRILRFVK